MFKVRSCLNIRPLQISCTVGFMILLNSTTHWMHSSTLSSRRKILTSIKLYKYTLKYFPTCEIGVSIILSRVHGKLVHGMKLRINEKPFLLNKPFDLILQDNRRHCSYFVFSEQYIQIFCSFSLFVSFLSDFSFLFVTELGSRVSILDTTTTHITPTYHKCSE